jgi:hypothetical protein
MPHFKAITFRLLVALLPLFAAAPVTAADAVFEAAKAGKVVDVWPEGKVPGRGAQEPEANRPPKGDNVRRIAKPWGRCRSGAAPGAVRDFAR